MLLRLESLQSWAAVASLPCAVGRRAVGCGVMVGARVRSGSEGANTSPSEQLGAPFSLWCLWRPVGAIIGGRTRRTSGPRVYYCLKRTAETAIVGCATGCSSLLVHGTCFLPDLPIPTTRMLPVGERRVSSGVAMGVHGRGAGGVVAVAPAYPGSRILSRAIVSCSVGGLSLMQGDEHGEGFEEEP